MGDAHISPRTRQRFWKRLPFLSSTIAPKTQGESKCGSQCQSIEPFHRIADGIHVWDRQIPDGNYSDICGHNVSPCPEKSLSSGFEANRRCFQLGRQPEAIAIASYKPT